MLCCAQMWVVADAAAAGPAVCVTRSLQLTSVRWGNFVHPYTISSNQCWLGCSADECVSDGVS